MAAGTVWAHRAEPEVPPQRREACTPSGTSPTQSAQVKVLCTAGRGDVFGAGIAAALIQATDVSLLRQRRAKRRGGGGQTGPANRSATWNTNGDGRGRPFLAALRQAANLRARCPSLLAVEAGHVFHHGRNLRVDAAPEKAMTVYVSDEACEW